MNSKLFLVASGACCWPGSLYLCPSALPPEMPPAFRLQGAGTNPTREPDGIPRGRRQLSRHPGISYSDEGLRSGDVIVTESGSVQPLMRRRRITPSAEDGAQVNQLVLVNNSKRPLILLAGEIVTGGKQDRVIGKDRIIPAESDPVDLGVFCVEPGRWTGSSDRFGVGGSAGMMQGRWPLRSSRQSHGRQRPVKVWAEVGKCAESLAMMVPFSLRRPG